MLKLASTCALLCGCLLSQSDGVGQTLRRLPAPAARNVPGFASADCTDASPELAVCKVLRAPDGYMEIVLLASGREVLAWPSGARIWRGMFDVRIADLDADGGDELLITDHVGTSNGIAVALHRASIVSEYATDNRSAISFDLEEY